MDHLRHSTAMFNWECRPRPAHQDNQYIIIRLHPCGLLLWETATAGSTPTKIPGVEACQLELVPLGNLNMARQQGENHEDVDIKPILAP